MEFVKMSDDTQTQSVSPAPGSCWCRDASSSARILDDGAVAKHDCTSKHPEHKSSKSNLPTPPLSDASQSDSVSGSLSPDSTYISRRGSSPALDVAWGDCVTHSNLLNLDFFQDPAMFSENAGVSFSEVAESEVSLRDTSPFVQDHQEAMPAAEGIDPHLLLAPHESLLSSAVDAGVSQDTVDNPMPPKEEPTGFTAFTPMRLDNSSREMPEKPLEKLPFTEDVRSAPAAPTVPIKRLKHDDWDDLRVSLDEYNRLSSKEKRQLRNKISARNFRNRRKGNVLWLSY